MLLLQNMWLAGNKLAFFLLQAADQTKAPDAAGTEDFSLWGMIQKMKWPALVVAIVLAIMSMYSIAVMVERWLTFNAARNQSRQFAPKVAAALRDNRIDEAIAISDRHKKSHLAKVVTAGGSVAMIAPQTNGDCNACHSAAGAEGAAGRIVGP